MRIALALVLVALLVSPAAGRSGMRNSLPQGERSGDHQDEILLVDGTVLSGRIVAETETSVTIETASLGHVELSREQIRSISRAGEGPGLGGDPDFNSIQLTPTPATVPQGEHYFRSFELLILNYGYGITDDLNLSLGALFPISTEWNLLLTGLKWQVADRTESPVGLAVSASYLIAPDDRTYASLGGIAGLGDARRSLNVAVDYGWDEDGESGQRILVGGDVQISGRMKLFAEWANSELVFATGDDEDDDELDGFINAGFRIFGESMAFTLGGFRPLIAEDTGSFVALPMLMFSAHW